MTGVWYLDLYLDIVTVSVRSMLKILAPYVDFKGAKNTHVLKVLIWGFGGCWRFLTGVWHLDSDFDVIIGLWYNHAPNSGSLS